MSQNETKDQSLPTRADIDAVLAFLPIFDRPGFKFADEGEGEQQADGSFTMPYEELSYDAIRFIEVLREHRFILSAFNWPEWQHEAERYINEPSALKSADLETICKLFTTHVRKNRFCEGHLAGMFKCGHVTLLLSRIAADQFQAVNDAPLVIDVEKPDERSKDVEEILHAVDIPTLGMAAKSLLFMTICEVVNGIGESGGIPFGIQQPFRSNVGVEACWCRPNSGSAR